MSHSRLGGSFSIGLLAALLLAAVSGGCQQLKQYVPLWNKSDNDSRFSKSLAAEEPQPPTREDAVEFKFAMARSLEHSGTLEEAALAYEELVRSNDKHTASHHRLAVVYDKLGKSELADKHYRAALKHAAHDAELLSDYGYSLYARGQFQEAEARLQEALKHAPHLTRAHNNLGLILARTGRVEDSLAAFKAAGCKLSEAHANAAFGLMLEGRFPDAEQQLAQALADDPHAANVRKQMDEVQAIRAREIAQAPVARAGQEVMPVHYEQPLPAHSAVYAPPAGPQPFVIR